MVHENLLEKPMSKEEVIAAFKENGKLEVVVEVTVSQIAASCEEDDFFYNTMGSIMLDDTAQLNRSCPYNYLVVGHDGNYLDIKLIFNDIESFIFL